MNSLQARPQHIWYCLRVNFNPDSAVDGLLGAGVDADDFVLPVDCESERGREFRGMELALCDMAAVVEVNAA